MIHLENFYYNPGDLVHNVNSYLYYEIKPPPLAERPQKALPIRRVFFRGSEIA